MGCSSFIFNFSNGKFELNDGNHRYQAMIDAGRSEGEVIIWTTGDEDMVQFRDIYNKYFD